MEFRQRRYTLADNFEMKARVGTYDQLEMAMALAFNDSIAKFYAFTNTYGLIFFSYLSDREEANLYRPVEYPTTTDPKKTAYETYIIRSFQAPKSVGPAIEYTRDWLRDLTKAQYEKFAGPHEDFWDMWSEPGVLVSTGNDWTHIGAHTGGICYVKPVWMLIGK